ncbi:MAG: NAD(P)-binding protein [Verrucomicrobia bacterium]|nr:NAD(P)-binding protein [Verrucomicrobiota bacterium]
MESKPRFLVVGAGFSGAVLARSLVEKIDCRVTIVEERPHLAGNCHTERDPATGVMIHKYGPHIFNTSQQHVWEYVNRFGVFRPWVNRVKAVTPRGVFSLPINLHTINQFFGKTFNPAQARAFMDSLGDKSIGEPRNFEEQALKFIGRELYETFFYGYTRKQWGCEPRELSASILKRLPVRFNYDDNYYNSTWQGIPEQGYTAVVEKIVDHPAIELQLDTPFDPQTQRTHLFFTGPLDAYFGFRLGRLGYRTVTFERGEAEGDFQGNAVLNYGDPEVPFTRIHEHKHFTPWEEHARTTYFREYSKETGPGDVAYYPKRLEPDKVLLRKYRDLGSQERGVSFLGRLATYRYMDMEKVIGEALAFGEAFAESFQAGAQNLPIFPNQE